MTDDDSAFVEIAARAPEVDTAADRLVPLYEDIPAELAPHEPVGSWRRRAAWRLFVVVVLALIAASGVLLFVVAVALGQHGMLPAPK